jgi:outer membrane lipoprotein-sorting protein
MKKSIALTLIALATTSLAGCGSHPVTAAKTSRPGANPLSNRNLPLAAPLAGGTTGTQNVQQLMQMVHAAQASTQGFSATVETLDKGSGGTESDTIKVAYKKPSTLHLTMVKATGQAQDASIVWTGGDSLQIKVKVGFMPITTSLAISDERVKSKNGWTIKQTEVNAIFKVLFDPSAQIKIAGSQPGDGGKPMTMLEVHSAQSPPGVDHEIIGVDAATGLPACRLLYKGTDMIYRLAIKNLRVGVPNASELAI